METATIAPRHLELEDALAFINTLEHSRDGDTEHLSSIEAAIDWLGARGAVGSHPVAIARSDDLVTIQAAREALREVADAVVHGRAADPSAIALVNGILAEGDVPELRSTPVGVSIGARHVEDPIADALAHLAEPLIEVIAEGAIDRLRVCADDGCRWVFYDTSRTARRRWCDMSTCGNRAKARRHRERLRQPEGETRVIPTL